MMVHLAYRGGFENGRVDGLVADEPERLEVVVKLLFDLAAGLELGHATEEVLVRRHGHGGRRCQSRCASSISVWCAESSASASGSSAPGLRLLLAQKVIIEKEKLRA